MQHVIHDDYVEFILALDEGNLSGALETYS
jgi:hypothetical protein